MRNRFPFSLCHNDRDRFALAVLALTLAALLFSLATRLYSSPKPSDPSPATSVQEAVYSPYNPCRHTVTGWTGTWTGVCCRACYDSCQTTNLPPGTLTSATGRGQVVSITNFGPATTQHYCFLEQWDSLNHVYQYQPTDHPESGQADATAFLWYRVFPDDAPISATVSIHAILEDGTTVSQLPSSTCTSTIEPYDHPELFGPAAHVASFKTSFDQVANIRYIYAKVEIDAPANVTVLGDLDLLATWH